MTGTAKEQFTIALKTSNRPASVRSAFDLPPEQQAAIQKRVNETFSADIHVQFETVPELVSGIELSTNGQKVAWSIADYLATLEKSAGELLHKDASRKPSRDAKSSPKPESDKHDRRPKARADVRSQASNHVNWNTPVASAPKADH